MCVRVCVCVCVRVYSINFTHMHTSTHAHPHTHTHTHTQLTHILMEASIFQLYSDKSTDSHKKTSIDFIHKVNIHVCDRMRPAVETKCLVGQFNQLPTFNVCQLTTQNKQKYVNKSCRPNSKQFKVVAMSRLRQRER